MTNVLTRSNDTSRSGHNAEETILNHENVSKRGIRRLFSLNMHGDLRGSEGQPLIVRVKMQDGKIHNVCFAADMAGNAYAWSADNGTLFWKQHLANPVQGSNDIDAHNINDHWCFLSTPVIDIDEGVLYLCSWSSPDQSVKKAAFGIHVLNLKNGHEVRPVQSLQSVVYRPEGFPAQNFNAAGRKQRVALTISIVKDMTQKAHKILWIAFGSIKETGPDARGWVVAIDLATWSLTGWTSAVKFNGGGIWQGAQGLTVEKNTGDVLGMTGNGAFDGVTEFGECFFRLRYTPEQNGKASVIKCIDHWSPFSDTGRAGADPTLIDDSLIPGQVDDNPGPTNKMDPINPSNFNDFRDQDLGSGGPLLIEELGLLVGAGKDGIVYVMDINSLGKTKPSDFAPDKITKNYARLKAQPLWFTYFPGFVTAAPTRLSDLDTLFEGKTHHQHSTPVHMKTASGHRVFTWGENGNLRAWSIDASGVLKYLACSAEIASIESPVNNDSHGGMPGGMLSGSSNQGKAGTPIIWALIPYGDANREISYGRFLVYDAENWGNFPDGSKQIRVLWDSERWAITFKFNKFNIPTIANGKIYIPTYESRIDVYGLT